MPLPVSKRRRVELANATLRKPFKSPLISRPVEPPEAENRPSTSPLTHSFTSDSTVSKAPSGNEQQRPSGTPKRRVDQKPKAVWDVATPPKEAHEIQESYEASHGVLPTNKTLSHGNGAVPSFLWKEHHSQLETRNIELEREISRLRGDTLQQLESRHPTDNKDAALDKLIVKWKAAARQAAEEVFEMSKSRVQNMGGMREVRAMQQRQLEFLAQFNDGPMKRPPAGEFDEVYDDYEADQAPEARMDPPHTSQDLNCAYTMREMLKSLNISFEDIGYDEAEDGWKD